MIEKFIDFIVKDNEKHALFLNALSYMELMGAKKIAAFLSSTTATKKYIEHAQEEFRHAHHLKRQIEKIVKGDPLDYSVDNLWGGLASRQYLDRLELAVCRLLKQNQWPSPLFERHAYLLITYAIEVRASSFYPIYEKKLREMNSPISIKSILLDEEHHLQEVEEEMSTLKISIFLQKEVLRFEESIYIRWLKF